MKLRPGALGYCVRARTATWSSELVIRHVKWAGTGSRSPLGDHNGHSYGATAAETIGRPTLRSGSWPARTKARV